MNGPNIDVTNKTPLNKLLSGVFKLILYNFYKNYKFYQITQTLHTYCPNTCKLRKEIG